MLLDQVEGIFQINNRSNIHLLNRCLIHLETTVCITVTLYQKAAFLMLIWNVVKHKYFIQIDGYVGNEH
ncbi:hypothetical protein BLOT_001093 [Blomia tropicalis]|nr:hypothetical protein BLOT_001093 [Blomia tropicalis]